MNNPKKSSDFPKWFKINRYKWTSHLLEEDPLSLYWEFRYRVAAQTSDDFNSWIYPIIENGDHRLTTRRIEHNDSNAGTQFYIDDTYEELVSGNIHPYVPGRHPVRPLSMADLSLLIEQSSPHAITPVDRSGRATSHHDLARGPYSLAFRRVDIKENLSVDSHRYSRHGPANKSDLAVHCSIDLTSSDDAIVESIRLLIPQWRKMFCEMSGLKLPKDKTAYRDLGKIVDYKMIPILDLLLWEKNAQKQIPEEIMVAKLANGSKYDFSSGNFRKIALRRLKILKSEAWNTKLYSAALVLSIRRNKKHPLSQQSN